MARKGKPDGVKRIGPGMEQPYDTVAAIMAWEEGQMDLPAEVDFFQHLIDTGLINRLQGMYGRRAQRLIDAGLLHPPAGPERISDEQAADRRAARLVDVAEVNEGIRESRKEGGGS
jgi:hypothetical protein